MYECETYMVADVADCTAGQYCFTSRNTCKIPVLRVIIWSSHVFDNEGWVAEPLYLCLHLMQDSTLRPHIECRVPQSDGCREVFAFRLVEALILYLA